MPSRLGHVLTWLYYQKWLHAPFPNLESPVVNFLAQVSSNRAFFFLMLLPGTGDVIYE